MKTITVLLQGTSPMSHSKMLDSEMGKNENPMDYERRVWLDRLHYEDDGTVFIPPMAFKQALATACKRTGLKIPGRGKSTYTKHFEGGVYCMDNVLTDVKKDQVVGEWINANADGVRGSGKRVRKCYPVIPKGWQARVTFVIADPAVTTKVFLEVLKEAGMFVGIGRFRPEKGGTNGIFKVVEYSEGETGL